MCCTAIPPSFPTAEQPAIKTVSIKKDLLLAGPQRLSLEMPGNVNLVISRRRDVPAGVATPTTPEVGTASANTSAAAGVNVWVGEVVGFKGPISSAVLVTAENGGVYGRIHYITRKGQQRTFTVRQQSVQTVCLFSYA
jgi:hypothetical protein